jgi:putative transposase
MDRTPRLNLLNIPQHIVQRGNNHQAYFFAEQDYLAHLDELKEYSKNIE